MTRPITFLSDYGLADEFVGVVHGVIDGICPDARVIDLTHGIRRHAVHQRATRAHHPGSHRPRTEPSVSTGNRPMMSGRPP